MSGPIKYLTLEALKAIHNEVLSAHGGARGIRDQALLEAALAAPEATMLGQQLISDPVEIAAAYLFYICRNHPFMDGNKRTALAACLVFLEENNLLRYEKLSTHEWEKLVFGVAQGELDRGGTTRTLRSLLKRPKKR